MLQPAPSTQELAQELVFREHQITLLQVEASMLAAELLRSGFLEDEGYNSPTDWLRFNCHLTDKVASDRINVGEHLAEMPMSVDYLRDGEIGYSHLTVMARTAEAVGKRFAERELLPLALELTPGKFYYKPPLPALDRLQEVRRGAERAAVQPPPLPEHGRVRPPPDQWSSGSGWRGCRTHCPGAIGAQERRAGRPSAAPALRRRPGRAGLGRQAGQHPGHGHDRALEGRGRRRRRGDGVLPSHLLGRGAAHGLRLQRDPRPAQPGVAGHGCGASQAHRLVALEARSEGARRPLPLARMRTDSVKVRRASPGALDQRRSDRARQPGPALSPAPSHGA